MHCTWRALAMPIENFIMYVEYGIWGCIQAWKNVTFPDNFRILTDESNEIRSMYKKLAQLVRLWKLCHVITSHHALSD